MPFLINPYIFGIPPLNVYTPTFCCGWECGQLGTSGQHWALTSTGSISTSTKRNGSRSLRINPTATNGYVVSSGFPMTSTHYVVRFYINFATLPSADCYIFAARTITPQFFGLAFKQSDSKLYCATGLTPSFGATGVSVTTGQWYRIDFHFDSTSGARTVDAQVNGTALAQKTSSATDGLSEWRLGILSTATADVFFDDFLGGNTAADYPFGSGYVNHFVPVSDGTHNVTSAGDFKVGAAGANITNATTDSWQLVDDTPLDDTTPDTNDYINMALDSGGGAEYVEHVFGPASGISTPSSAPRAVEAIIAYHGAAAAASNSTFKLNDNGTESTIFAFSGTASTSIRYARKHYKDPPSGLGGWSLSGSGNFNNLRHRFGYSTDANPDQYFDCAMIEAEFTP